MCADFKLSDEEGSDLEYESKSYVNLKSVDKAIENKEGLDNFSCSCTSGFHHEIKNSANLNTCLLSLIEKLESMNQG